MRGCWLLLTLISFMPAAGQSINRLYYDTVPREATHFDPDRMADYRDDNDFDYSSEVIRTGDPVRETIARFLDQLFEDVSADDINNTVDLIYWILILTGAFALVYFLLKAEGRKILSRSSQVSDQVRFLDFEGSRDDLDQRLAEAERSGNYPLALRLLFIKSLHNLERADAIVYNRHKTNGDYLREIHSGSQKQLYGDLRRLFDYTNYGAYPVDTALYEEACAVYDRLTETMTGGQHA